MNYIISCWHFPKDESQPTSVPKKALRGPWGQRWGLWKPERTVRLGTGRETPQPRPPAHAALRADLSCIHSLAIGSQSCSILDLPPPPCPSSFYLDRKGERKEGPSSASFHLSSWRRSDAGESAGPKCERKLHRVTQQPHWPVFAAGEGEHVFHGRTFPDN